MTIITIDSKLILNFISKYLEIIILVMQNEKCRVKIDSPLGTPRDKLVSFNILITSI